MKTVWALAIVSVCAILIVLGYYELAGSDSEAARNSSNDVSGPMTITGPLTVTGDFALSSPYTATFGTGAVTFGGAMTYSGEVSFDAEVNANRVLDVHGDVTRTYIINADSTAGCVNVNDSMAILDDLYLTGELYDSTDDVDIADSVTIDGTNKLATFADAGDALELYAISANRWFITENIGSVSLAGL